MQYTLNTLAKRLSDWKVIIGVSVVVGTTLFNSVTAIFNYALITKLAPINTKVSAIEDVGIQRDKNFADHKVDNDRQYGDLTNKINSISNKLDALTLKLIGKTIK